MTTNTAPIAPAKNTTRKHSSKIPVQGGGQFLVEDAPTTEIFTAEDWDEEQLMLAQTVEDFFIQEVHSIGIEKAAQMEASKDLPLILEVFHRAAELGLCGTAIEERFGGMDLDFNTGLRIGESLALGFSFATTIGAQTSIGSLPIVYYGTEEQKAKYLPGIASGEIKASYCLTEPSAGSDANSGKTKATLSTDGNHYLINGQKMWITNGGFADLFIVFAKIEDDERLSAFLVEKVFGGITIGKEEKKLGIKASSTTQVFFENCPVPLDNLLGTRGGGFKIALNILNTGRIKLCASSIGGCKFAVGKGIEYAKQRIQFDKPISDFGAIKHKIGEIIMQTHVTESALYRIGKNIDIKQGEFENQGISKSEAKLKAIREYAIECAILKVVGSEVLDYAIDEVLQIHGGMGYAVETGIEMGYRDARITRIYEGTNEINRMLSVAELTKRALKTKEVDLMGAGKKIPMYLLGQMLPFRSTDEQKIIANFKKVFLLISGAAGKKLGKKMVDEQEIVMNLSDILATSFIAESAYLRAKKVAKQTGIDKTNANIQWKIVQLYLYESLEKVRKFGKDAINSYADGIEKKMMLYALNLLLPKYDINPKEWRRAIADYGIEKNQYPF